MPIFVDCKHGHMIDIDWMTVYRDDGSSHIDVHAALDVIVYTKWLLEQSELKRMACARAIDQLLEIRGWFWEVYLEHASNFPDLEITLPDKNEAVNRLAQIDGAAMRKIAAEYVKPMAIMLDLGVSED